MPWSFYDKNGNLKQAAANAVAPAAKIGLGTNQSVANNTATTILLDTTVYDTYGGMAVPASNRIIVPVSGKYRITGGVEWGGNAAGRRQIAISINGVTAPWDIRLAVDAVSSTDHTVSTEVSLNAGDIIMLTGAQTSGGALNANAGTAITFLSVAKIDGAVIVPVVYPASLIGQEMAYAEWIGGTINVTATTAATAQTIVTAPTFTADGTSAYKIEAFVPDIQPDTTVAGRRIIVALYEGSTSIEAISYTYSQVAGVAIVHSAAYTRKLTPAAGARTYSLRAYVSAGTALVAGSTGGTTDGPVSIRITKAS